MPVKSEVARRIAEAKTRIRTAAAACGREFESIQLVAVSKTKSAAAIRSAHAAGLSHFGESYVQEGVQKIGALRDLPLCWHFVGPIQSNKTRLVAEHFDWVHSVDRLKIAERLARQRGPELPPLNVLLQVNISGEASKSGAAPDDLIGLAEATLTLPSLRLRGLMAVPAPTEEFSTQRAAFRRVRELLRALQERFGPAAEIDQLSIGMSADLEAAVAEGATMVRLGTAIFGARDQ